MGLIKAALGSAGGVLADQWKEYFYCDAMDSGVLVTKGQKRTSGRSSNTKGVSNIISNGSVIAVADGQCMCIVEQGKVVDFCAEPGEYTYNMSTEPSLFAGKLGTSIKEVFKNVGKRFTFGGDAPKDQRVYYFNTKEIIGNKYGTPVPVPFRVVDERAGIDIDINITCFGEYSFKLINPLLFYVNVCGNVEDDFKLKGSDLERQMRSEFLTKLQPAFAKISAMGIRYSALLGHADDLSDVMKEELTEEWKDHRGIEVCKVGLSAVKAPEEDEKMLKELQRNAAFMDPTRAAAHMVGSQASAMQAAASNASGAAVGFMGMNVAQGAGGINTQNLFEMGQQQAQKTRPSQDAGWTCQCGKRNNHGKFCPDCGSPKPMENAWECACGAQNKGKFCSECGKKKPAEALQYRCDKCGWEPQKGTVPPKFCPECGDSFDNGDLC